MKQKLPQRPSQPQHSISLQAHSNLISPQSIIRHIIYRKPFFNQQFPLQNPLFSLPHLFPYTPPIPHIIPNTPIHYFITTKIPSNHTNQIPNHTIYSPPIHPSH
ncbi:hypothetical protein, partial [Paenibacillus xylanexedens]|uniref:glycoside hydrolase family 38 N-terminal domain-containing protein n=1 Tax=Paenibacillus xylanexedens TaxID=528191 RepID=UPI0034D96F58